MGYYLALLILLAGILFLLLLSKKYGSRPVAISVVVGGIIAFVFFFVTFLVTFKVIFDYAMKNTLQSMNTSTAWHQVTDINDVGKVIELEYRSELGVFAHTENGEILIAGSIPTCLPDGEVAVNLSPNTYAELTQTPRLKISTPAEKIIQQLFFDIVYPAEADELGVSSYVLNENGEVWCSEVYARGGLGGGVGIGFGAYLLAVMVAITVAVPLFVLAIVVFFISLGVVIFVMKKSETSLNHDV